MSISHKDVKRATELKILLLLIFSQYFTLKKSCDIMNLPHKNRIYVILFIEVGILLLVKVLTSVFPFLYGTTFRFCVVANRSRAFFGAWLRLRTFL